MTDKLETAPAALDPLVQKMIEIIVEELKSQREDNEGIFFREDDWMIDGRLDIASLATAIIERVR